MSQVKVIRIFCVIIDKVMIFHHELRFEVIFGTPPSTVEMIKTSITGIQPLLCG